MAPRAPYYGRSLSASYPSEHCHESTPCHSDVATPRADPLPRPFDWNSTPTKEDALVSAARHLSLDTAMDSYRFSPQNSPRSSFSAYGRAWKRDSDASSIKSNSSLDRSPRVEQAATCADENDCNVLTPLLFNTPFLPCHQSNPSGCTICVDSSDPNQYEIKAVLPGFQLENITIALKRSGSLHLIADRWDDTSSTCPSLCGSTDGGEDLPQSSEEDDRPALNSRPNSSSSVKTVDSALSSQSSRSGHFERMIQLGPDAVGSQVKAGFDGKNLTITIGRRRSLTVLAIAEAEEAEAMEREHVKHRYYCQDLEPPLSPMSQPSSYRHR